MIFDVPLFYIQDIILQVKLNALKLDERLRG